MRADQKLALTTNHTEHRMPSSLHVHTSVARAADVWPRAALHTKLMPLRTAWAWGGRDAFLWTPPPAEAGHSQGAVERTVLSASRGAAPVASQLAQLWEESTGAAADALVHYQLGIIYMEAHCGLLVMGDRLFYRSKAPGSREGLRELAVEALREVDCSAYGAARAREAGLR